MKKVRKYLFIGIILLFFNNNLLLSYNEIYIDRNNNTALKVSTASCYVHDIYSSHTPSAYELKLNPTYVKPSNDSIYLKSLDFIYIDSALIKRLDDSFFELRKNDTIDYIEIINTDFDYDHLIQSIIKNNIKLNFLYIDLEYVDFCPKNIEKISGLKRLSFDFGKKNIEIDNKIYELSKIECLGIGNSINSIDKDKIAKMKKLKELIIGHSDSVIISKDILNKKNFWHLTLQDCQIFGNTLENISNSKQLTSLTLEHCNISDGMIDFSKLKKLEFLNLYDNNFTQIPKEIFNLEKLHDLYFSGNKIVDLPINLLESLPARKTFLTISISDTFLSKELKEYLLSNKEYLESKGYRFNCYKYYDY